MIKLKFFLILFIISLINSLESYHHPHHSEFFNLYSKIESKHTKTILFKLRTYLTNKTLCEHIYLDVGTNIGVQIRKLYEPHYYPKAPVLEYFHKFFGEESNWKKVCAIGFEPNYKWTQSLTDLQNSYNSMGYPVIIFTETAVNIHNQNVTFYTEPYEKPKNHEWGSSLLNWNDRMKKDIAGSISFSSLLSLINTRAGKTNNSKIFMKLDIEGAEYMILPDLLLTGAICHVNFIAAEWHPEVYKETPPLPPNLMLTLNWIIKQKQNCSCELINLDDETYGNHYPPLPTQTR